MDPEVDAAEIVDPSPTSSSAKSQPSSAGLALVRSLILALAAGTLAAAVALTVLPLFDVPAELRVPFPPPEIAVAREASTLQCRLLNAVVFMGSLGFFMSLLMGVGEAAVRRFSGGVVGRLVAGVVLATIVAGLSGALGQFLTQQLFVAKFSVPVTRTVLAQACMLGLFGIGVAAAVGLVVGGVRGAGTNVVSGLMAGILVAFLFPLICSLMLPNVHTEVAIPGAGSVREAEAHLVALAFYLLMITVTLGVLIPLGSWRKGKRRAG